MTFYGIDRSAFHVPMPPEVKAASDRISIGYGAGSGLASFLCQECEQSSWLATEIKHKPECATGKVLATFLSSKGIE